HYQPLAFIHSKQHHATNLQFESIPIQAAAGRRSRIELLKFTIGETSRNTVVKLFPILSFWLLYATTHSRATRPLPPNYTVEQEIRLSVKRAMAGRCESWQPAHTHQTQSE